MIIKRTTREHSAHVRCSLGGAIGRAWVLRYAVYYETEYVKKASGDEERSGVAEG